MKLPSGGKDYTTDVLDMPETGEIPVYPMTAIDEITSKTPDALFNGVAVTEIIKSCIPAIKDPWKVLSVDLDAILIAIKSASSGDSLEIDSECPKCKEVSTYSVSLVEMLSKLKPIGYDKILELGNLKIKFKPLTFADINEASIAQFNIQKDFRHLFETDSSEERDNLSKESIKKVTLLTMEILSKTIEYIQTPNAEVYDVSQIYEFFQKCDRNTYATIRDYNAALKIDAEIKPLKIKCPSCAHEYDQSFSLNPSDFFE